MDCRKQLLVCGLIVVSSFLVVTDAYQYLLPQKAGSVVCTDESGGKHQPGETWYNDAKCERHICHGSGGVLTIEGSGCGSVSAPGCKLVRGPGSYPDCCPTPRFCNSQN